MSGTVDVRAGTLRISAAANLTAVVGDTLASGNWKVGNATLDFGGRIVTKVGSAACPTPARRSTP